MNEDELVRHYQGLAFTIARDYYLPGSDRDDVRQEAMIGVLHAIRDHRPRHGSLDRFVALVVNRHLVSCIRRVRMRKYRLLTESARYGTDPQSGLPVPLVELAEDPRWQPEEALERRGRMSDLLDAWFLRLTDLERRALLRVLDGVEYAGDKSLDGAIQRARRKLRAAA